MSQISVRTFSCISCQAPIRLEKLEPRPGQKKTWQRWELDGKTLHKCRPKSKKEEEEEGGEPNNQLTLNNPQAMGAAAATTTTTPPTAGEKKIAAAAEEKKKEEQEQARDLGSAQASLSDKVYAHQIATLCDVVAMLDKKIQKLIETVEALSASSKSSRNDKTQDSSSNKIYFFRVPEHEDTP